MRFKQSGGHAGTAASKPCAVDTASMPAAETESLHARVPSCGLMPLKGKERLLQAGYGCSGAPYLLQELPHFFCLWIVSTAASTGPCNTRCVVD